MASKPARKSPKLNMTLPTNPNAQFFVGIGAQKAGTTWLAHYLNQHPQVCFSPIKELHYFDSQYRRDIVADRFEKKFLEKKQHIEKEIEATPNNRSKQETLRQLNARLAMTQDPQTYQNYFSALLQPQHRAYGEITPSYALLKANGFTAIKHAYPQAKFIFIIRDPVDRYWSHLKFHQAQQGKESFNAQANALNMLNDPWFSLRTTYQITIQELEKAISPQNILILFFENLMAPASHLSELSKLTDFLQITHHPSNIQTKINPTHTEQLTEETQQKIARHFAQTYQYIAERTPTPLPQQWQKHQSTL